MNRTLFFELILGVSLLGVCAILAKVSAPFIPGANNLLIAVIIGITIANTTGVPSVARPGVQTHKLWLATGIVLMGASLTVESILARGILVLAIVLSVTTFTIFYVEFLSRVVFGFSEKLSSLLAVGSSICGVSAVVAVAGSIRASEEDIAYAAATVLLFDAVTLFIYPIVGNIFAIPSKIFGMWAGVSMFSTGPVIAVGFMHSAKAGEWATITKLARNALIGVVAVAYAAYYTRKRTNASQSQIRILWAEFPKFILGFIAFMFIASAGFLSTNQISSLVNVYNWLFLLAFVGLGTEIRFSELRSTGISPALVVLIGLSTVSVFSLLLLFFLFG
ncbi:YeiH family protein [Natrinema halophilum]|uniref:YeiH family protein n=1 Tax=Natrinema halophilum TaxID=1699371 RepID=UPI001F4519C5|nr:putative sulfate exporter family transporter [Natrinema halophilum]UHQ96382.1 YeiH family protein [Natrinema halophilum]